MPIPKIIWQTWTDPYCTTEDKLHPIVREQLNKTRSLNPTYEHRLLMGDDLDNFVHTEFKDEPDIIECYDRINIIVSKVDLWRYLVLYKYGGVYLDMDSAINRSLDEFIKPTDNAILTAEGNKIRIVQWALIFSPKHPILKYVIDQVIDNIKNDRYPNDILRMTGPITYVIGVNKYHRELYNKDLVNITDPTQNLLLDEKTNITFGNNNHSYRLYGVDYNEYFDYKYPGHEMLCQYRPYWRLEIENTKLLKDK